MANRKSATPPPPPPPAAPKTPRKAKPAPPLIDWKALHEGPALRGLTEVLGKHVELSYVSPTVAPPESPRITTTVLDFPPPTVTPTVGYTSRWTAPEPPWVDQQGILHEARRVQAIQEAEHSMTMGEERFYQSVWNSPDAQVESADCRTFTLGYDKLAKLVRLDEKSVRQLLPKLVFKRIVEIVAGENSSARIGRTYRIFGPAEILRRQRAAGLQHIVKKGRAVEFVWPSGHPAPTAPVQPTVGVPLPETDAWIPAIDTALREFGADPDAAAVRALVDGCRKAAPDVTAQEIIQIIHERGRVLRSRPVSNALSYFVVSVPAFCSPERLRKAREDARAALLRSQGAARDAEADLLAMREEWESWLKDPAISDDDKAFARQMLARGGKR